MTSLWKLRFTLVGFIIMTYLVIFLNSYKLFEENTNTNPHQLKNDKTESLHKLAKSILRFHKALRYFEVNNKDVNLDGLFGLRISQGIFQKLSQNKKVLRNENLSNLINLLNERIQTLAEKITKGVEHKTPEYYASFKEIISKPFLVNGDDSRSQIKLRSNLSHKITAKLENIFSFNERFSDSCYTLLLNESTRCGTTNQCLKFFTDPSAAAYYLNHQLIYFLLAKHIGCTTTVVHALIEYLINTNSRDLAFKMFSSLNEKPDDNYADLANELFSYFCTQMYQETQEMFSNYTFEKSSANDMFIEQNVLCGLLNIKEFLNDEYLNLIYTFQTPNGCFGKISNLSSETLLGRNKTNDNNYKLDDLLNQIKSNIPKQRSKRYDVRMANGCSSHETGLALAYYSLMIKNYIGELHN